MFKTINTNRSKSVGTDQSTTKNKNQSSIGQTINSNIKEKNFPQIQTPMKKYKKQQFSIKIQEFNPANDTSKKQDESFKQSIGISELSTSSRLQMKENKLKNKPKKNELENILGNINQSQSSLQNVCKRLDYSNQNKNGKLKISNNIEQQKLKSFQQNEKPNQGNQSDQCKLPKDQFASTSIDLRFQKFNILSQKSQRQYQLVPQLPSNKVQFQPIKFLQGNNSSKKIGETKIKTNFVNESNNSSQKISNTPIDSNSCIDENNKIRSYSTNNNQVQSNKQIDKNTIKTLYFLSSHLNKPKSMQISQNDISYNPSQKQIQTHTSIIASMMDMDENSKQPQSSDLQNDLYNMRMMKQNSKPNLLKLDRYLSINTNKKYNSIHQSQDSSETKSPKLVNFSLNNQQGNCSLIRGDTQKSMLQQEEKIKSKRQLSFKERLKIMGEKDNSPLSPTMNQIQFSLLALQQKSSKQIPSMAEILPQTQQMLSPLSQKRGECQIKSDSNLKVENQQSMKNIKSKNDIKFKKVDSKSIISTLLPMSLKRIVEKPFKQNIEILKYGIDRQDLKGPKISITENELFSIFHRVIDHYDIAIKNENDAFRKMHSTQAVLYDRLCVKITNISDSIKAINTIKDGNSKISKIIYKLFEQIKHLRFIFFETETVTDQMQILAELSQKEEIYPSLLFGGLDNIQELTDRLYHNNFKQFFTQHDFDILLEYIIFPDLDVLQTKVENYLNKLNVNRLQKISENVESTVGDMFKKQSEYIYKKKNPQRIHEALQYQIPSFTSKGYNFTNTFFQKTNKYEARTNCKIQKSESQFNLNGQVDNLVQDITKTLKKYQFGSPYSSEINPELKQQIVKMYNTTQQEI